jgi:AraC-like DNA-binding protein
LNRYQLLHATADISVNRFDHPPHEAHEDREEELASRWAIAFVLAGSFDMPSRCIRRCGEASPTARDVGLTSTTLTRAFRRYGGASPHEHVLRWRLAVAAELIDSGVGVSETCYRAGFENLSHFAAPFSARSACVRPPGARSRSASGAEESKI